MKDEKMGFYFTIIKIKGDIKWKKTEEKESDNCKRNTDDVSEVFQSIAIKLQHSEKPPKDTLEEEVRHVPLWLADPISDGDCPDLVSRR